MNANTLGDRIERRTYDRHAPTIGIEPPQWTLAAVCQSVDPELFFPEKGQSTREAKKVCSGCPVTAECLMFALANGERFGIYGGLSERERRRLTGRPTEVAKVTGIARPGVYPCPDAGCQRVFGSARALGPHRAWAHRAGAVA